MRRHTMKIFHPVRKSQEKELDNVGDTYIKGGPPT